MEIYGAIVSVHVSFVEASPLARDETGITDDAAQFSIVSPVPRPGGADDVFFDHDAAHVVDAESESDLSNL